MRIDFWFDFSCPYAYLASTQIEATAARAGAEVRFQPMLLGGVFRAVGTPDRMSEGMPPGKARHNALDMMRWAALLGVPLRVPAGHPIRTVRALRGLLTLPVPMWPRAIHALYRAYWVDGVDLSSEAGLRLALAALPQGEVERAVAGNGDPSIKEELRRRTDAAIAAGIFGAPTSIVDGALFWGQDRLPLIEAAARGWRPGVPPPGLALVPPAPHHPGVASPEPTTIDFFFDLSSPFAYLGSTQIERIARQARARLRWRPMLLGGLFRAIGTPDVPLLAVAPARQRYHAVELERWAGWWRVPFRFTSRFPIRTVRPLRLLLLAGERIAELTHAFFRAAWVDDRDLGDEAVLRAILGEHGFHAEAMLARTDEPAVKQALIDATVEAERRGVFGAPTAIVVRGDGREDLFWGQDRLDLAGLAAAGWLPPIA